jgi:SAM-dependent methyltransferase
MKKNADAYGRQLLAQYERRTATGEIIERDDDYIAFGSEAGPYFTVYDEWPETERRAIDRARGRILDVGCGAGRHSLYLQEKGFDVTGIDNSPGAISVCRQRGLKKALVRSVGEIEKFKADSFDTILMLGNNFGLFGDPETARRVLGQMSRATTAAAQIVAGTRNPYLTNEADHLAYHRLNKRRGRMAGQIRMRVRCGRIVGEWFDYLFVSPPEMEEIVRGTDWEIREFLDPEKVNFFAVIGKTR